MNFEQIYPQVMYHTLHSLVNPHSNAHNQDQVGVDQENIFTVLEEYGYSRFIDQILRHKNLDMPTFTSMLNAYFLSGNYKEVVKCLKKRKDLYHDFDIGQFIEKVCLLSSCEDMEVLEDLFQYILLDDKFSKNTIKIFSELWKNQNYEVLDILSQKYLQLNLKEVIDILQKAHKGEFETNIHIGNLVNKLFTEGKEPKGSTIENHQHSSRIQAILYMMLKQLHITQAPVESIITIIDINYERREERGIFRLHLNNDIYKYITDYYYSQGNFKAIQGLTPKVGNNFQEEEFLSKKFEYAINNRDQEVHKEALQEDNERRKKIVQKETRIAESCFDSDGWCEDDFVWYKWAEIYSEQAQIFCNLAFYELIHGDKKLAEEYIQKMITTTLAIYEDIPKKVTIGEERHIENLKTEYESVKKNLKKQFFDFGFGEFLPSIGDWNQRLKEEEGDGVEENEEDIEDYIYVKKQEARELQQNIDASYLLNLMLEEKDLEESLKFLSNDSYSYVSFSSWERAMQVLDVFPESFNEIYTTMTAKIFDQRDHGHRDYDEIGFAQFLAKAEKLGCLDEKIRERIIQDVNTGRFTHDGTWLQFLLHDFVVELLKNLISIGSIEQAWNIFSKMRELDNRYTGKSMMDITVRESLSQFIQYFHNSEYRDGNISALKGEKLPDSFGVKEAGNYYYIQATTASILNVKHGYANALTGFHGILKTSSSPSNLISIWCKSLVENTLFVSTDRKQELLSFLEINDVQSIRWRVIYSLAKLGISHEEIFEEIQKKGTPKKIQKLFFLKLAEDRKIHDSIEFFMDDNNHISYLCNLLRYNRALFDNIINGIQSIYVKEICGNQDEKVFSVENWKDVFDIIEYTKEIYELLYQGNERRDYKGKQKFFKEHFDFFLKMKRKGYLQSRQEKDNIKNILRHINIYLLKGLARSTYFYELLLNSWDGTLDGFEKTFITYHHLHSGKFGREINAIRDVSYEEERKRFFRDFVCKRQEKNKNRRITQIIQESGAIEYSSEKREENIAELNRKQIQFLQDRNARKNRIYEKVNISYYNMNQRTLVLYCRTQNISATDFVVLARVLEEYIEGGYSKVFNNMVIVSRESNDYYQAFVGDLKYRQVRAKYFVENSAVFGNMVHFTHGLPQENEYGSIPILGATVRGDHRKMNNTEKFVPLHLKLDDREHMKTPKGEKLHDGDHNEMGKEMIRAVIELEDRMLIS